MRGVGAPPSPMLGGQRFVVAASTARRLSRAFLRIVPLEVIDLARPKPVFNSRDEVVAHGVPARVSPLGSVTRFGAKLSIPKIIPPYWMLSRSGPDERRASLPVFDPLLKREFGPHRCTEKVDVIGQNHKTADRPGIGLGPRPFNGSNGVCIRQKRFAIFGANGHEYDGEVVLKLARRPMHRMTPARFAVWIWR